MKPLYITAIVTFSGKTALALGIGLKLQAAGHKVGYWKPLSAQPVCIEGKIVDEDSVFVRRVLGLDTPLTDLSTVVIDETLFEDLVKGDTKRDFVGEIKSAYQKAAENKDVLIVEGGASMREGYSIGMNTTSVSETLELPTLGVVRYRTGLMLIDDILALQLRVGKRLLGVVINNVPGEAEAEINGEVRPYLERHGVKIYGALPHERTLMWLSVGEAAKVLNAKVLTSADRSQTLIENLSVGAMSVESALPRFRRSLNKAVITGGDRADIQAAALETSTVALILTGNLQPSPTVLQRADELGVAVLSVPGSTMETVEAVEKFHGRTRLGQPEKLDIFRKSLETRLDWDRLLGDLGISLTRS